MEHTRTKDFLQGGEVSKNEVFPLKIKRKAAFTGLLFLEILPRQMLRGHLRVSLLYLL